MAEQKKTPEKSSKAVVAQRVDEVIDLLLAGAMARDIVHYGSEKGWQVGARQVGKYITAANELIAASLEKDREKLLADHLARRRRLFAKADQVGDYSTALRCAQDEAQLCGLYPPKQLQHSGALDLHTMPPEDMTLEQLHAASAANQAAIDALVGSLATAETPGRGDGTPAEGQSES
jgi:hypothetical protein